MEEGETRRRLGLGGSRARNKIEKSGKDQSHCSPRAALEARRLEAADLFRAGLSHSEIARRLGVSRKAVIDWHKRFAAEGVEGLQYQPTGRPRRLSDEQYRQIAEALLEGPEAHGYPTQLWTLERIAQLIERLTGVPYAPGYVWYILRERLGFTSQKPTCRAAERDEEAIEHWKQEVWPEIKKGQRNRTPF
jgi:transposase